MKNKLFHGDCYDILPTLPDGSVDAFVTDPPYGNMDGSGRLYKETYGDKFHWDTTIDPAFVFAQAFRLLRPNGRLILFSQEPYTSQLITNTITGLPFSQRLIWLKHHTGNPLGCNKNCVGVFEDILLFTKRTNHHPDHPLKQHFLELREFMRANGVKTTQIDKVLGNGMASHYFTNGLQFCIPTEEAYQTLQEAFSINTWGMYKTFAEIQEIHEAYLRTIPPATFNLWRGETMKTNVFSYKKEAESHHINQKPVGLLEDLIQTYTNEGDRVLDFTMGSGSTCVAAERLNRRYIGIEKDPAHFATAQKRVKAAEAANKNLFTQPQN